MHILEGAFIYDVVYIDRFGASVASVSQGVCEVWPGSPG